MNQGLIFRPCCLVKYTKQRNKGICPLFDRRDPNSSKQTLVCMHNGRRQTTFSMHTGLKLQPTNKLSVCIHNSRTASHVVWVLSISRMKTLRRGLCKSGKGSSSKAAQLLLLIAFDGSLKMGAASGVRRMTCGRPDWPAARGVGVDRVGNPRGLL